MRSQTSFLLAGWLWAAVGTAAAAHPNGNVDQQVALSLGLETAEVSIVILPSSWYGAALFGQVDRDRDGLASAEEGQALAQVILDQASLSIDGQPVDLSEAQAMIPSRDSLARGMQPIVVVALAQFPPISAGTHVVDFSIAYVAFGHEWSVQPHYDLDLIAAVGTPRMLPSARSNAISIQIQSTAE